MRRCLIAALGAMGCLVATQAVAERRVALVVGNAQYAHTPALPNPRNDAQDIADTLKKVGFEVTLGYDLDQIKFARIIDDFARALEGADIGLFFYAGHGLQINERNYLVSTEAKLESAFLVPSETIELDAVVRLMEAKTGTNLIFIDACRNNPLTDNLKRNLTAVNRAITVGRGLARVEPTSRDTLIAFSAAPGQEAADGRGRNSPFTAALLRHLVKPGVEVSVMLKEVTADVRRDTNNAQRPQQLSDMSKTFYFVNGEPAAVPPPYRPVQPGETKAGGAATAPVAPADPGDPIDVAFWQSAAAANECESIRAYLRRFPNGKFVDLARIAERRLCKAGPEVAIAPSQRPSPSPLAPGLTSGPAAAAAPAPSLVGQPSGAATNVAVAVPPVQPLPAAPAVSPVVAPDIADVGRKLQRELLRVGCAASGIEIDGTWGTASRDALRSFNERTRSIAVVDRPTQEALEAVRGYRERVCPLRCEPGTELRGTACVAIPKALERSRRASRPPARELPLRAQSHVEPGRADPPRSQSYANEPISPNNRNGESWIYVGKQRCKTYEPPGAAPRIICP
ncbi:MAG TPA: caspase family protein [Xanthobacteraceae bacterium]|nr:caspase family protein [Xanthobacteraceae bacterium]